MWAPTLASGACGVTKTKLPYTYHCCPKGTVCEAGDGGHCWFGGAAMQAADSARPPRSEIESQRPKVSDQQHAAILVD